MGDAAPVGDYGTLRLLSKKNGAILASYPIDQLNTTFGRQDSCDVRMYFAPVAELHSKLFFEDKKVNPCPFVLWRRLIAVSAKAFLTVLGTNGVEVDGCRVLPQAEKGTTVPLMNNSVFMIHTQRFQFEYPPKEMRAQLLQTPRPKSRKSLRLSMIESAHIMSPTPRNGKENKTVPLHALRSPVKPYATSADPAQRSTEVTMADSSNVVVVEEEKDLVVLEVVDKPPSPPPTHRRTSSLHGPSTTPPFPLPAPPPIFVTPQRQPKSSKVSLHKAVLMRNSRMAYVKARDVQKEAEEEEEVEDVVSSPERDSDEEDEAAKVEERPVSHTFLSSCQSSFH
jgi:pSer/pThr/pTyr-binding forkhead associated (FHA) protein